MPVADAGRAAEISKLKNKLVEVEAQLKEQKKIGFKLRDNSTKKIEEINSLNASIVAEIERFRWRKEQSLFTRKSVVEKANEQLKKIIKRQEALKEEMAYFDILVYENEMLHSSLKDIAMEQLTNSRDQSAEREKKKQSNFDTRMAMEEILRKTIKNFDFDYKSEAINKMQVEASQASSENLKIFAEFDLREAKTNELIRQQQISYEQLMKLKIERDVASVSTDIQENDITKMTRQIELQARERASRETSLQKLKNEVSALQSAVNINKELAIEYGKIESELKAVRNRVKRCSSIVTDQCHKVLCEGFNIVEKERAFRSNRIAQIMGNLSLDDDELSKEKENLNQTQETLETKISGQLDTENIESNDKKILPGAQDTFKVYNDPVKDEKQFKEVLSNFERWDAEKAWNNKHTKEYFYTNEQINEPKEKTIRKQYIRRKKLLDDFLKATENVGKNNNDHVLLETKNINNEKEIDQQLENSVTMNCAIVINTGNLSDMNSIISPLVIKSPDGKTVKNSLKTSNRVVIPTQSFSMMN